MIRTYRIRTAVAEAPSHLRVEVRGGKGFGIVSETELTDVLYPRCMAPEDPTVNPARHVPAGGRHRPLVDPVLHAIADRDGRSTESIESAS